MTAAEATPRDEIRRLFSFDERERRIFPPLRAYADRIGPQLDRLLADPEARQRFMLAGLFLSYRAANHQGLRLATDEGSEGDPGVYADDRTRAYRRLGGTPIRSAAEYRERLGLRPILWSLTGLGRALARFVERG